MAELDFSKIFGETATSKASFTDENYLRGWGYLGSTPPPYQLFDYLQSINDKKTKYLYDKTIKNDNNLSIHNADEHAHDKRFNAIIQRVNNMITPTDDSDKQSLAPTLSLVKTMLGNVGIAAQRLGTNGYIKFANGFTAQWGDLTDRVGTFIIPFSTTVFFAVATSNTVHSALGRPVIPMKPVTTLTNVSFTGYISVNEQANAWTTAGFDGKYFCIGI